MYLGIDVMVFFQVKCVKYVVRVNCNGLVMKFLQGEFCIVVGGLFLIEEWFLKILYIILIGGFMRKYFIFIDGIYYIFIFKYGRLVKYLWIEIF